MTEPRPIELEPDEPTRCGKYRLIEPPLGEGTYSTVYRAEHVELGSRFYAVKVLKRRFAESPRKVTRFQREARSLARLRHKGLCTVIDWGIESGRPWFSMEFVEGRTLEESIAESHSACADRLAGGGRGDPWRLSREDVERFVKIVIDVAAALHHAHEAGIVHRDVKPRNIIVDLAGEPHLVDFGLAKDLPSFVTNAGEDVTDRPGSLEVHDLSRTLEWEDTGTLPYMPPESLVASEVPIDRRFDVWSLGVSLYECLAGRLPFHAPTAIETRKLILSDSPAPSLRERNARVSRDLEAVVLTAIEKEASRRYGSALEFAEDLRRVLGRVPIRARPTSLGRRMVYFAQRRTGTVLAGLAILVVLSTGLALSLGLARLALAMSENRAQTKEDGLVQRLRATPVECVPPEEIVRRESLAFERVPRMIAESPASLRPVAWFRFDGDCRDAVAGLEGKIVDVDYVHSGEGSFTAAPPGVSTVTRALKLDGGEYVEVSDGPALDLRTSFTIDFWIKPEAVGGVVLMKGVVESGGAADHAFSVDLAANGDGGHGLIVRFGFAGLGGENGSVPSVRPLDLHRWNHVRCRSDRARGTLSVTLDGDESEMGRAERDVGPMGPPTNDWPLTIGVRRNTAYGDYVEGPFIGLIADLRISREE